MYKNTIECATRSYAKQIFTTIELKCFATISENHISYVHNVMCYHIGVSRIIILYYIKILLAALHDLLMDESYRVDSYAIKSKYSIYLLVVA